MKRLLLLRHAKAEQANKETPIDLTRALTERGRDDARKMGQRLAEKSYRPELILCSPSTRTRQTLEFVDQSLRSQGECRFVDGIYAAGARQLLTLVQTLPDNAQVVMLVGHNPGLEDSLALLGNGAAAPHGFPTSAVAVLDFEIDAWRELAPHTGTLVEMLRL